MKKLIATILFLTLTQAAIAEDIRVSVKGMVCGFCAQGITKKFKSRAEVETVNVSLEKKLVTLKTKPSIKLPDSVITDILTDAGYNIDKIERN